MSVETTVGLTIPVSVQLEGRMAVLSNLLEEDIVREEFRNIARYFVRSARMNEGPQCPANWLRANSDTENKAFLDSLANLKQKDVYALVKGVVDRKLIVAESMLEAWEGAARKNDQDLVSLAEDERYVERLVNAERLRNVQAQVDERLKSFEKKTTKKASTPKGGTTSKRKVPVLA